MKNSRFVKLCEFLCGQVEGREAVSEEILSDYISELAKVVESKSKPQDFSYHEMVDICRKYQIYHMKNEESFSYMVGSILGSAELYQKLCAEEDLKAYEEKVLSPNSTKFLALKIISEEPGISRQELLDKLPGKRTPSAVSHLTGLLKKESYISSQKVGQERRYFATSRGDKYVQDVKAVQRNELKKAEQEQSATSLVDIVNINDRKKSGQVNSFINVYNNMLGSFNYSISNDSLLNQMNDEATQKNRLTALYN